MFGTHVENAQKFASIEADLISSAAEGTSHLHAEVFKKFASLIGNGEDYDDVVAAVLDEVTTMTKTANLGRNIGLGLGLGAALSGPAMLFAKSLSQQSQFSSGLANLKALHPEMFQQDPMRAEAIYKAVFSVAPNIAGNTVLMGDLLRQMMSMPMLDLGTISKIVDMAKNRGTGDTPATAMGTALLGAGGEAGKLLSSHYGKTAGVLLPKLDWATAIKKAGLTDAFTGSGSVMQQANQNTQMDQQELGNGMASLDAVVQELLQKEQELAQREEILMQQEQQLQDAMKEVQGAGDAYQNETGVDPNSGDVIPEGGSDGSENMDGQGGEESPAPGEDAAFDPVAGDDGAAADPAAGSAPGDSGIPSGEDPSAGAEGAAGPGADAAGAPVAEGAESAAYDEAAPPADGSGDGSEQPPAFGSEDEGNGGDSSEVSVSPDDDVSAAPSASGDAPSADEDPVASGDAPVDDGSGEQPAEEAPAEGPNEISIPGESAETDPEAEHNMDAIGEGEDMGPNTAESVEGTPEDEAHDEANMIEAGSPEDEVADQELASVLNAGGHTAGGDHEIPAAEPVAADPDAMLPPAPVAPSGITSGPSADGGHEIVLPLRISIKVGERAKAYDAYQSAMSNLFTPKRG